MIHVHNLHFWYLDLVGVGLAAKVVPGAGAGAGGGGGGALLTLQHRGAAHLVVVERLQSEREEISLGLETGLRRQRKGVKEVTLCEIQ